MLKQWKIEEIKDKLETFMDFVNFGFIWLIVGHDGDMIVAMIVHCCEVYLSWHTGKVLWGWQTNTSRHDILQYRIPSESNGDFLKRIPSSSNGDFLNRIPSSSKGDFLNRIPSSSKGDFLYRIPSSMNKDFLNFVSAKITILVSVLDKLSFVE